MDVKSENAKRFRELFDKGEVPEGMSSTDKTIMEKEAELEMMRKGKGEQRDYFKKLEEGKIGEGSKRKEPKLLVGKLKEKNGDEGGIGEVEELNEDVPEMASLSSRFAFFEHHKEKEEEEHQRKRSRKTPPRLNKSHIVSNKCSWE